MTPAPIRYIIKAITLLPTILLGQLSKLIPRDMSRIVIGAWYGKLYADNPKYFVEYLIAHTNFKVTWIGDPSVQDNLPKHHNLGFARKGSLAAIIALCRAKFWICCIGHQHDLTSLPIDRGAICINLWHGIPIKRNGQHSIWDYTSPASSGLRAHLERLYARIIRGETEWLAVASEKMIDIQTSGFPICFSTEKILRAGSPRNDFLVNNQSNTMLIHKLKEKIAQSLKIDPTKNIVTYLPTWRLGGENVFCFYNLPHEEQIKLHEILEQHNAVLLEKHHFHTYEKHPTPPTSICSIPISVEKSAQLDTQELLLATDMLISDYSGAYIDFGLLHRPCLHFAYDLDDFSKNGSGLAYNLADVAAGPISRSYTALIKDLIHQFHHSEYHPQPGYHDIVRYEKGISNVRIAEFISSFQKRP